MSVPPLGKRWSDWPVLFLVSCYCPAQDCCWTSYLDCGTAKAKVCVGICSSTIEGYANTDGVNRFFFFCGHIGVQESHCHAYYDDISGLCLHQEPWWPLGPGCCLEPCLGLWSYHILDQYWCLWTMLPPNTTQMPRSGPRSVPMRMSEGM